MPILKIHARQIFDSRGNPTVEVDLTTDKGISVKFTFLTRLLILFFFFFCSILQINRIV